MEVYSDGGSQLTAAYKELKIVLKDSNWSEIQEFGATEVLDWHFTPGGSPWKNGCSEALVSKEMYKACSRSTCIDLFRVVDSVY